MKKVVRPCRMYIRADDLIVFQFCNSVTVLSLQTARLCAVKMIIVRVCIHITVTVPSYNKSFNNISWQKLMK